MKRELGLTKSQAESPAHPGYVSTILHSEKKEGDILQVSHPYGTFGLDIDAVNSQP